MNERELWIDNVKVIAIILVVLGHFFQSMVRANIIVNNDLYRWFNQTIYFFHVPLFFICSGYLYQRYSKVYEKRSWKNNILKKALSLGIPYFVFSIITLMLKKMFVSVVNTAEGGFFTTLFITPTAPYWFLYTLFFVFLITPTFKSQRGMSFGLAIAIFMKVFSFTIAVKYSFPYIVCEIVNNEIWFIFGVYISMFNLKKKFGSKTASLGILFLILSVFVYFLKITFYGMSFLLGTIACISVVSIAYYASIKDTQNRVFKILSKYNFPIFLMHTIFAACFRGILLKLRVNNAMIHVSLGLIVSFIGPVIAAWIMEKTGFLDIVLYPSKYIKIPKPKVSIGTNIKVSS